MTRRSRGTSGTGLGNVLSALGVTALGFVFLTIAFLLYALIVQLFDVVRRANPESEPVWLTAASFIIFIVVIGLVAWVVLRARLPIIVKASFLMVPIAVALVIIGILLNSFPLLPYLISALLIIGTLFYLVRTEKSWLYDYSTILIAVVLAAFNLSGGTI